MAFTIEQTDTTPNCAAGVYCSGLTANAANAVFLAQDGGTAGVTEKQVTIDLSASNRRAYYFECLIPAGSTWSEGTWTVRFNLTSSTMSVVWHSAHICRVNSSCTNQTTIGSSTSLGIGCDTTGVKSTTVTGSEQTPSVDDKVVIVLGFNETSGHGTNTIGITPDQVIDSPFNLPAATSKPYYYNWRRRFA